MTQQEIKECLKQFNKGISRMSGQQVLLSEIENVFTYKNKEYALIKFKFDESENWRFGVVGGFDENLENGCFWSELDFLDHSSLDECKAYIDFCDIWNDENREKFNNLYLEVDKLFKSKEYEKVISLVDENIKYFNVKPNIKNAKFCEYPLKTDFFYYNFFNSEQKIMALPKYEFTLLSFKVEALINLKRYSDAEFLNHYLCKLTPKYAPAILDRIELYIMEGKIEKAQSLLPECYDCIWYYQDYLRFLKCVVDINYAKQEYRIALVIFAIMLSFDNGQKVQDYVNGERKRISEILNEDVLIPSLREVEEQYAHFKILRAKKENIDFCFYLYHRCLLDKDEDFIKLRENIKQNLIKINRNWPLAAEIVETNVLTENRTYLNADKNFRFLLHNKYQQIQEQNLVVINRAYHFVYQENEINIDLFDLQERIFYKVPEYMKKDIIDNNNDINETGRETNENGIQSQYYVVTDENKRKKLVYFIFISPYLIARVSTVIINEDVVKDVKTIVKSFAEFYLPYLIK